jgi:hypothetical protein
MVWHYHALQTHTNIHDMKNNDEQIVNCIMMWMVFLGLLFASCLLGLTMAIIESIMQFI